MDTDNECCLRSAVLCAFTVRTVSSVQPLQPPYSYPFRIIAASFVLSVALGFCGTAPLPPSNGRTPFATDFSGQSKTMGTKTAPLVTGSPCEREDPTGCHGFCKVSHEIIQHFLTCESWSKGERWMGGVQTSRRFGVDGLSH